MRAPALLSVLVLCAPLCPSPAAAQAGAKEVPVRLEPRLATAPHMAWDARSLVVRWEGASSALAHTLREAGLQPTALEPWALQPWWIVRLADADVRSAASQLGAASGLYSAPLFRSGGELAFPTERLLLGVACGASGIAWGTPEAREPLGDHELLRVVGAAPDGFALLELAAALRAQADVLWVEPDLVFTGRAQSAADDPLFADAWGLHNSGQQGGLPDLDLDAPQAWGLSTGSASVRVALFDDGVQLDHPDLGLAPGEDFTGQGGAGGPMLACDWHGTAVAGCISGALDNNLGSVGVAPACRVAPGRVFVSLPACDGSWTTQTSWTLDALDWAEATGARISLNPNVYSVTSVAVEQKYADTRAAGMLHVAAAGEGASVGWPASLPEVLAVSPITRSGALLPGAATGPEVALCAPGQDVWTTDRTGADGYNTGDHVERSGSSFAAAYVAGVAALAFSRNPFLDADEVELLLSQSALDLGLPGPDSSFGAGLVNALECARAAAPAFSTQRIDIATWGAEKNKASFFPTLSADGRYVAFDSVGSNLVLGDTNGFIDGFVHDRQTGITERVTLGPGDVQGNKGAGDMDISSDGRVVCWDAAASNLVLGDTNDSQDAFVRDLATGITERISVDSNGVQGNNNSLIPAISGDGRLVVFRSKATNLIPDDTNAIDDCFLHDRATGLTTRISVGDQGQQGDSYAIEPEISDDGTVATFNSASTNLVPGDTNGVPDIYLRDLVAQTTELISVSDAGVIGDDYSINAALSSDGRYVVFESDSTNLVPNDTNGERDIFLRDRVLGTTIRVSEGTGGVQGNGHCDYPWISGDGRTVAFYSDSTNLVAGDTNGIRDVFVKDLASGSLERISVGSDGSQTSGVFTGSTQLHLSRDGRYVAFESLTSTLVPGDTNLTYDIYVHDRMTSGGWSDLGRSTPGATSDPRLHAVEGLEAGAQTQFLLSDAPPSSFGGTVLGIAELHLPLLGGVLVPSLTVILPALTAADGTAELVQPWPSSLPSGTPILVQTWIIDFTGPQGFSASNALSALTP